MIRRLCRRWGWLLERVEQFEHRRALELRAEYQRGHAAGAEQARAGLILELAADRRRHQVESFTITPQQGRI